MHSLELPYGVRLSTRYLSVSQYESAHPSSVTIFVQTVNPLKNVLCLNLIYYIDILFATSTWSFSAP